MDFSILMAVALAFSATPQSGVPAVLAPVTAMDLARAAAKEVSSISPEQAHQRLQSNSKAVLFDVRDSARIEQTGTVAGAVQISAGALPFKIDEDPHLSDRSRPVMVICDAGPISALTAQTLRKMGFRDIAYVSGGMAAWKKAGLPMESST